MSLASDIFRAGNLPDYRGSILGDSYSETGVAGRTQIESRGAQPYFLLVRSPPVELAEIPRPDNCRYCESDILQSWGRTTKPVRDLQVHDVEVQRFRCADCKRTFRAYPQGLDRTLRSQPLRKLAICAWAMGLSLDTVVAIFKQQGIEISRSSIWRDRKRILGENQLERLPGNVAWMNETSSESGTSWHSGLLKVVIDLGSDENLVLGIESQNGSQDVYSWIVGMSLDLGLELAVVR